MIFMFKVVLNKLFFLNTMVIVIIITSFILSLKEANSSSSASVEISKYVYYFTIKVSLKSFLKYTMVFGNPAQVLSDDKALRP